MAWKEEVFGGYQMATQCTPPLARTISFSQAVACCRAGCMAGAEAAVSSMPWLLLLVLQSALLLSVLAAPGRSASRM